MQKMFKKEAALKLSSSEGDAPAGILFLVVVKEGHGGRWAKGDGGGSFFVRLEGALSEAEKKRGGPRRRRSE